PLRREKNVFDILYYSQNGITECPRNNFFVFINDVLVTPKDFLLHGVTRKVVLEIAKKHWKVEERKLELIELNSADEAFITSTTKSIMPVTVIDDKKIGDGKVGDNTQKLMNLFKDYSLNY
ncbi:MAG: amino acid aminotransferase, partial [Melioribacteraceae bacterium]